MAAASGPPESNRTRTLLLIGAFLLTSIIVCIEYRSLTASRAKRSNNFAVAELDLQQDLAASLTNPTNAVHPQANDADQRLDDSAGITERRDTMATSTKPARLPASVDSSIPRPLGPAPITALVSSPGGTRRRLGVVECLTATPNKDSDAISLHVGECGTYSRRFDRMRNKSVPVSLFKWNGISKQIQLDQVTDAAAEKMASNTCLEGKPSQTEVVLEPCDDAKLSQKWELALRGGRHKKYYMIKNKLNSLCLTFNGKKRVPIMTPCSHDTCDQILTFSSDVESLSAPLLDSDGTRYKSSSTDPKVLCWILTYPKAHGTKGIAINATWARKCSKLLFMTTEHFEGLNTVALDIGGPEDRGRLWNKSREAWSYVYRHEVDNYDWFLKADDDTYIVWENLMAFVKSKNPDEPRYFGRQFNATRGEYYGGGSGILLSRGALRKVGMAADKDYWATWSTKKIGPEDLQTGQAMSRVGIHTESCVDESGAHLFFPLGPQFEYVAREVKKSFWFYRISVASRAGPTCCSKKWIGTHYMSPSELYLLDDYEEIACAADLTRWPHLDVSTR